MKTPLCPSCKKELVFIENADVTYRFNEEREKYDEVEKSSLTGLMCDNCGESPWGIWEEDETSDIYERMEEATPPSKFRVYTER